VCPPDVSDVALIAVLRTPKLQSGRLVSASVVAGNGRSKNVKVASGRALPGKPRAESRECNERCGAPDLVSAMKNPGLRSFVAPPAACRERAPAFRTQLQESFAPAPPAEIAPANAAPRTDRRVISSRFTLLARFLAEGSGEVGMPPSGRWRRKRDGRRSGFQPAGVRSLSPARSVPGMPGPSSARTAPPSMNTFDPLPSCRFEGAWCRA
jgi:hypothetical protein